LVDRADAAAKRAHAVAKRREARAGAFVFRAWRAFAP